MFDCYGKKASRETLSVHFRNNFWNVRVCVRVCYSHTDTRPSCLFALNNWRQLSHEKQCHNFELWSILRKITTGHSYSVSILYKYEMKSIFRENFQLFEGFRRILIMPLAIQRLTRWLTLDRIHMLTSCKLCPTRAPYNPFL